MLWIEQVMYYVLVVGSIFIFIVAFWHTIVDLIMPDDVDKSDLIGCTKMIVARIKSIFK